MAAEAGILRAHTPAHTHSAPPPPPQPLLAGGGRAGAWGARGGSGNGLDAEAARRLAAGLGCATQLTRLDVGWAGRRGRRGREGRRNGGKRGRGLRDTGQWAWRRRALVARTPHPSSPSHNNPLPSSPSHSHPLLSSAFHPPTHTPTHSDCESVVLESCMCGMGLDMDIYKYNIYIYIYKH